MNTKTLIISIGGIIISFIGGFLLANSMNRAEINKLQSENAQIKKTKPQETQENTESTLSDEEIKQKIAQADQTPQDIGFQRNLGLALYRYGAMKENPELISESTRLLKRANEADQKDFDVLVALGNAYFDIASIKQDKDSYARSKEFYAKALDQKSDDAEVRADYGATFLFSEPPEIDKSIEEFDKALRINPKNERAMQFLAQAYIKQNKTVEAQKTIDKLKEVNPQNRFLPSLLNQLAGNNQPK